MRSSRSKNAKAAVALDPSHQHQDEQDDQNKAEAARRVVAPVRRVGPRRQAADHQDQQDDEQDPAHGLLPCFGSTWDIGRGNGPASSTAGTVSTLSPGNATLALRTDPRLKGCVPWPTSRLLPNSMRAL